MATLAEKIKAAAAKLKKTAEVKNEIATTVGASPGASMTEIKTEVAETKQTITETLGLPPETPLTEVTTTVTETKQNLNNHETAVSQTKTALGIPSDAPLSTVASTALSTTQSLTSHRDAMSSIRSILGLSSGASLPAVVSGVQSAKNSTMTFYKCASIDTENKTWTGHKAVFNDGAYSFEGAATKGLTYGNGLTPVVASIYDTGVLVYVNRLWMGAAGLTEGLVIHAPLQYRAENAETGQAITYPGNNCTFGNVAGVACATFSSNTKNSVNIDSSGIVINTNPMSLACWVRYAEDQFEDFFGWPDWNAYHLWIGRNSGNVLFVDGGSKWGNQYADASIADNEWHHLCLTWDGDALEKILYLDGRKIMSRIEDGGPRAGDGTATYMYIYSGYETSYADFRLYNRTLSPEEVAMLAANLP